MTPAPRLGSAFEPLEDRSLPTTFGVPWADPEHLTFSFVADGTQTPLGTSSLSQVLNAAGTSAAWKAEVLRAFQTWAASANINIGLVADGGQALGAVGAVQGDARFGDIRVAAAGLSPELLASASPFSFTGSTLSGDVVLNASAPFGIGRGSAFDVYSVLLHEAGHTLGLDHDHDDEASAIHEAYQYQTGLSATDIAHLQALYGARRPDAYDAAASNDTAATATALPRSSGTQLLAGGDLTTMADVDYYKFTAPALTSMVSGVTVRLKASGMSLLTASVTVYDAAGRVVASGASTDPLDNDLTLTFRPGLFGGNYTIKVEGARGDVFDVGAYTLAVDTLSVAGVLTPVTTALAAVADGHTDDVLKSALKLDKKESGDARFDAVYRGVIEDATDVDTYRIGTKKFAAGTAVTLNVMVWGLDSTPVDARVKVYDANGNAVAFQVLANDRGLFSVQVLNATAGKDYFVQVMAREGAAKTTGSYVFAADFNTLTPLVFDNVASGSVAANAPAAADTVTVGKAGLFQFALAAQGDHAGDAVTMTVYDEDGNAVLSLTAVAGRAPVTASRYLTAGAYTVRYTGAKGNAAPVGYGLFMLQLSEGVGPYATSTASKPSSTAPSSGSTPPASSTPPSSGSTPPSNTSSPPPQEESPSYSYSGSSSAKPSGYYYTY